MLGQTNPTNVWRPQQQYLQSLYQNASNLYGQGSPSQGMINQFAQGGAQDINRAATGAWNQQLQADPSQSPYFQSAVGAATRPMVEQFTQSVIPQLRSGAVQGGTFGGSRRGLAEGMAATGLARQVGDVASQMGQQAYGQGLQARGQALGMAPQMMALGFQPGQVMQQAQWDPLRQYAGIIGGPAMTGGGGWQAGLSGLGEGVGAAMLLSDKRAKTGIKFVKKINGINIYRYKYKPEYQNIYGDSEYYGVIAQEIAHNIPDAVSYNHKGYMMVDYEKVSKRVLQ